MLAEMGWLIIPFPLRLPLMKRSERRVPPWVLSFMVLTRQERAWYDQDTILREKHRHDLMQLLAYANLTRSSRTICCLVYPCSGATWQSLQNRQRLFHQAQIPNVHRPIQVWLTALPMCAPAERYCGPLVEKIRNSQAEQGSA
jgi:hypothetical protein